MTMLFSIIAATKVRDDSIKSNSNFRSTGALVFSTPLMLGIGFVKDSNPLNQSTRIEIYNYVKNNPGVHLRGICSGLGISIGVAQYHLQLLTQVGLLCFRRYGRYKRYFKSGMFDEVAMKLVSFLRHGTAGRILTILLEERTLSHSCLASRLGISSQALTWQIDRLRGVELIDTATHGAKVRYLLSEEGAVLVKKYRVLVS